MPKRFKKPTLEEVEQYILEKNYSVDPHTFHSYYEANGWYVGRKKMKSWQHAVTYWESRRKERAQKGGRVHIKGDPGFEGRF